MPRFTTCLLREPVGRETKGRSEVMPIEITGTSHSGSHTARTAREPRSDARVSSSARPSHVFNTSRSATRAAAGAASAPAHTRRTNSPRRHRRPSCCNCGGSNLRPRPLFAACVDPASHGDGGCAALARLELGAETRLGGHGQERETTWITGGVGRRGRVGIRGGTSFTHTLAPSTPAGRARRVGVDSSTSRSWCVSRCPLSTSASGRDDGPPRGCGRCPEP